MANENKPSEQSPRTCGYYIEKYSCGSICVYKKENTKEINEAKTKELVKTLNQKGYGVSRMEGSFIESHNTEGSGVISLFVVNEKVAVDDGGQLERDLIELGQLYDQECIMSIRRGAPQILDTSKRQDSQLEYGMKRYLGTIQFGQSTGKHVYRVKGRPFGFK